MTSQRFELLARKSSLHALARSAQKSMYLAVLAALACACSGPSLATASSEPRCPECSVIAESETPFVELQSENDTFFVLDERGAILALSKLGGELTGVVAAGSGAVHFGVTQAMLAWVSLGDPSGTPTNTVHAAGRDGSGGPVLQDFQGAPLLGVGLGDAFVGAFSVAGGSEVIRYSLADGTASAVTETLTNEEASELPVVAGGEAEVVWCRTHADLGSRLWRLGASGDATSTEYPFSCANLWTSGDGQVFVEDSSSGMNCYFRVDAAGETTMLTCTSHDYEHFTPLADGGAAFVDDGATVQRITTDGQVSPLFTAENVLGIARDGNGLSYATPAHIGGFTLPTSH